MPENSKHDDYEKKLFDWLTANYFAKRAGLLKNWQIEKLAEFGDWEGHVEME